jgi:DNA polymerase (family 10)
MASLDTAAVAALLREYGQRAALRGGNPYRAKAYIRAADRLRALAEPLDQMIAQGRLREIPGVGDVIADIIIRLHANGIHPYLEAMRQEIPASVLEMLSVWGLRPDKVLKLYRELASPRWPNWRQPPAKIGSRASKALAPPCKQRFYGT